MSVIYLIESGVMLSKIKSFISEVNRCKKDYIDFAEKFGAGSYLRDGYERLSGISLTNPPHGWTKPTGKHFETRPKKGSADYGEFAQLPKMPSDSQIIAEETGVPIFISWKSRDGVSHGSSRIGPTLYPCGFLFIQEYDIYAFYVPDVKAALSRFSDCEITNGADKWEMNIEGVRQISGAEWMLIEAQCDLKDEQGMSYSSTPSCRTKQGLS